MTLTFLGRANHGIEWIASAELELRSARVWRVEHRALRFQFSAEPTAAILAGLRTLDDVFLWLADLDDVPRDRSGLTRLASLALDLDRSALDPTLLDRTAAQLSALRPVTTRTFTVVASAIGKRNYGRYEMEEAVGMALARSNPGWHFEDSRLGTPDSDRLSLRLHVAGGAFLAARVFHQPLHRRAYRTDTFPGALRPPVAAAMALLVDPLAGQRLLDPFCGAGTIPIELAACRSDLHLLASDASAEHLESARHNARRAGAHIELRVAPVQALTVRPESLDAIVTNPPWDQKVELVRSGRTQHWLRHLAPALHSKGRAVVLGTDPNALAAAARAAGLELALAFQISLFGSFPTISCLTRLGADFFRSEGAVGQTLRRNYERYARARVGPLP